ncbi:MAG: PAS domain-containing protein [Sulfuritalea sp.]|nr:PAS domain-containing protein [Sulfuritalea sp.]
MNKPEHDEHLLREHQAIFESAAIGMVYSRGHRIERCNRRLAELFGYAVEELVGREAAILCASTDEYARLSQAAGADFVAGRAFVGDVQTRRKDGTEAQFHISGRLIDPDVAESEVVWTFEDITEQRRPPPPRAAGRGRGGAAAPPRGPPGGPRRRAAPPGPPPRPGAGGGPPRARRRRPGGGGGGGAPPPGRPGRRGPARGPRRRPRAPRGGRPARAAGGPGRRPARAPPGAPGGARGTSSAKGRKCCSAWSWPSASSTAVPKRSW